MAEAYGGESGIISLGIEMMSIRYQNVSNVFSEPFRSMGDPTRAPDRRAMDLGRGSKVGRRARKAQHSGAEGGQEASKSTESLRKAQHSAL